MENETMPANVELLKISGAVMQAADELIAAMREVQSGLFAHDVRSVIKAFRRGQRIAKGMVESMGAEEGG